MAARGTALVPTRVQIDNFPKYAEQAGAKFPAYAAHMRDLHARADAVLRAAYEAGVPIFAGTDAGGVSARPDRPGGGCPARRGGPHAVRRPGCRVVAGPRVARLPGPVAGAPADFVVYDEDPLADLRILATPARVVLRGRVVA